MQPGAIVLMHEGAAHGRNVETMTLLLRRLDELGYRTVLPETLEAAIGEDGVGVTDASEHSSALAGPALNPRAP